MKKGEEKREEGREKGPVRDAKKAGGERLHQRETLKRGKGMFDVFLWRV